MRVRIFTNEVAGGWLPTDLDEFLGGSEECVVLLAEALVRAGHSVDVFHSRPDDFTEEWQEWNGVFYAARESVKVDKGDVLITFKNNLPWLGDESDAAVKIHWSSDVENPWDTSMLDYYVHLTPFHQMMHIWMEGGSRNQVVPHGIDLANLSKNTLGPLESKEAKSILYCSSPDRGLGQLLDEWPKIRSRGYSLKVAYGFKNIRLMGGPQAAAAERVFIDKLGQEGIEYLGQLKRNDLEKQYWLSEYWILPLMNPASELFCLNALKSRHCGCLPIINRIGALQDTVASYYNYRDFVDGGMDFLPETPFQKTLTWDEVVEMYWEPMLNKTLEQ